ncbi:retinol dehydrogenase 8-like [Strongylocentrotus purpuratus]|uniref:Uncharacterized protein n=1 Tax=Strongylocentrotus purpuratus TaxID=7668 RepID=A0A7M7P327_STRPU|nr:retinol dehydrogenase 8-like [Strongylocentrotus purpuratus]
MAPLVVLISGCSTGIGLALAARLAQDPDKKYLVYATMRNLAKKEGLEKATGDALDKTLFVRQLDVTVDDQVKSIFEFIMGKHGRVDVLVNNAGFGFFGPLEAMSMEKAKSMFDTNYFGTVRLIQAALPIMKKQKSGRIVNISSILGHLAMPYMDVYNATKFAMEGLTESLLPQLKHFGISISTVQPGPVATKFAETMSTNSKAEDDNIIVSEDTVKDMTAFEVLLSKPDQFTAQETGPVIDVIVECVQAEKPKLRYPTSENVRSWVAKRYREEGVTGLESLFE